MKKLIFLSLILTGCTTTHIDKLKEVAESLNNARHALEPLTDANCVIANQVETAIKPELVKLTQDVCQKIKDTRPMLDKINDKE